MIAGAAPSLAELGAWSPGLQRVFVRYAGTAMLSASSMELQRLRKHLFEACRIDPCDLALFDHFPPDDRRAIVRELHALVHARMRERQDEHARRVAALEPVDALRRALLTDADRQRLVELGIWAHMLLGDTELTERLVDRYFDLTTVERVRAFAADQETAISAFRFEVTRLCGERQARARRTGAPPAALTGALAPAYATLGVPITASRDEVCLAFRTMAKQYHPDLGGNETRMKEINQAYALIAATWR